MKKLFTAVIFALTLAACATTENAQVSYVKACATYSTVFKTATDMREAGKLSSSDIETVRAVSAQATPICTGKLPANPDEATRQVTAAITTLTILEAAKKVSK